MGFKRQIIALLFSIHILVFLLFVFPMPAEATTYGPPFIQQSIKNSQPSQYGFAGDQNEGMETGDFNGDGYDDLAIGDYYNATSKGIMYLYKGTTSGLQESYTSVPGQNANDRFGYAVSVGNLNNDAYDDLIVSAVYYPSGAATGRLYIFFGKADFFTSVTSYSNADLYIDAEQAASRFGGIDKVGIGDYNNDGWQDLAIGAYRYNPGSKVNAGRTYVLFGGASAWSSNLNAGTAADFIVTGNVANGYLGQAHYTGDINDDGIDDIIISTWRADLSYRGELDIFYGSSSLSGLVNGTTANLIISGVANNDNFAAYENVSIGDIDHDGKDDLIAGASLASSYSGKVYIFLGSSGYYSSPSLSASGATITLDFSSITGNPYMGYEVIAGNFDNDDYDDVIVGSLRRNRTSDAATWAGGAYFFAGKNLKNLSGSVSGSANVDLSIDNNYYLPGYPVSQYSRKMAFGDFNNNGTNDIVVVQTSDTGRADIMEIGNPSASISLNSISSTLTSFPTMTGTALNPDATLAYPIVKTLLGLTSYYPAATQSYWDSMHTGYAPALIKDGSTYKMWYSGYQVGGTPSWRMGYATSSDGIAWTKYSGNSCSGIVNTGCIFEKSANNNWDDAHIYGLSVIKEDSTYKLWYSGNDGTYLRVGYATSSDGITWTRYAGNTCTGTVGNGCLIGLGASGTWDDYYVSYPKVIKDGSTYKMWYSGHDGTRWTLGYATSTDGITWTKYSTSPVLGLSTKYNIDAAHTYLPAVFKEDSTYKMWYTAHSGYNTRSAYATSTDGINWTKLTDSDSDTYRVNIANTQIRVDSGSWASCTASDGSFNSQSETFSCTPGTHLTAGSHTAYIRQTDATDFNTPSAGYASQALTVSSEDINFNTFTATYPSNSSVVITYDTSAAGSTKLEYGFTNALGRATTETDTSSRVTTHTITLTGLRACTTYFYRAVSTDSDGNQVTSDIRRVTTTGCIGSTLIRAVQAAEVSKTAGGTVTLNESSQERLTLRVPPSFTQATSAAAFQINRATVAEVVAAAPPPTGNSVLGTHTYELAAMVDDDTVISTFDQAVSITMNFTSSEAIGYDIPSLHISRWDGSKWTSLTNCRIEESAKTVTCDTTHFSFFALFGHPSGINQQGNSPLVPDVRRGEGATIKKDGVYTVVEDGTIKDFDTYLSVYTHPKKQPYYLRTSYGTYWQISPIYEVWYIDFFNKAIIDKKYILKSSLISLPYTKNDLETINKIFFPEKSLRIAYSTNYGKTWKILPGSVVDQNKKIVATIDKIGAYYMIVGSFTSTKTDTLSGAVKGVQISPDDKEGIFLEDFKNAPDDIKKQLHIDVRVNEHKPKSVFEEIKEKVSSFIGKKTQ